MSDNDMLDRLIGLVKDLAPDDVSSVFFYIALIMLFQAGKFCFAKYCEYKENIERDRQLHEQIKIFLPVIAKAVEGNDLKGIEHLKEIIDSILQEKNISPHSASLDKNAERRKLINQLVNDKIMPLLEKGRGDVTSK